MAVPYRCLGEPKVIDEPGSMSGGFTYFNQPPVAAFKQAPEAVVVPQPAMKGHDEEKQIAALPRSSGSNNMNIRKFILDNSPPVVAGGALPKKPAEAKAATDSSRPLPTEKAKASAPPAASTPSPMKSKVAKPQTASSPAVSFIIGIVGAAIVFFIALKLNGTF